MDETDQELSREELLNRYKPKAAPPTDKTARRSPFKFLDSYDVGDSDIFFGRDNEIAQLHWLYHNLGHVLIYGESGSGKTSLVQCGLRARIPAEDALFIPLRIGAEGLPGVCRDICQSASQQLGEMVEYSPEMTLIDALMEARAAASRPIVLFFDQFEELLIFHDADARRNFAEELAKIRKAKINVKVIIGIRQDFLAQLTELEEILEGLFGNRFWLRRMSRENAAQAVVKACATCDVKIDVALAESIIRRLDPSGQGIELPYLQVVMDRLYRQAIDTNPDQPMISASDVAKLGDVAQILGTFLAEEVEKLPTPDQGRQVLKAFVSREGTRRTLTRKAIAQEAASFGEAIPPAELDTMLSQLIKVRILREDVDAGVCELRHDTLAATVFSWISQVEKELIEVRDNLANRYNEYQARNKPKSALLDQGFMDYVSVYKHRLKPLLDQAQREYLTCSERELTRRKSIKQLSVFGGILAAILMAFLFVAGILREQARSARARADAAEQVAEAQRQKFDEARKTVDQFFVTVSEDTLLNQPGMQDLRKTLLSDAGDFFKGYLADLSSLPSDKPDDTLLADLARTNYYLGQLAESTESKKAALVLYKKARQAQEDLVLRTPHDKNLLSHLGDTLNAIGRASDNLGNQREQAWQAYTAALERRKKLATDHADDPEYQRKYASTMMNMGLIKRDRAVETAISFNEAVNQLKGDPVSEELSKDVFSLAENLIEEVLEISDSDVMQQIEALQEKTNSLKSEPGNEMLLNEVLLLAENLRKEVLTISADVVIEQIEQAQAIRKRALERNKLDNEDLSRIRRDLAIGYWNLGMFKQEMSDKLKSDNLKSVYFGYNDAVDFFNEAASWCDKAIELVPNDQELHFVLGETYRGLGSVYKSDPDATKDYQMYQSRYQTQQKKLELAKKEFEQLAYFNPREIQYHAALGRAEMFLGNVYKYWIKKQLAEAKRLKDEDRKEEADQQEKEAEEKRLRACQSLKNAVAIFNKYKDEEPAFQEDSDKAQGLLESMESPKPE